MSRRGAAPAIVILSPTLMMPSASTPRLRRTLIDAVSASQSTTLPLSSVTASVMCPCGLRHEIAFTTPVISIVFELSNSPAWL